MSLIITTIVAIFTWAIMLFSIIRGIVKAIRTYSRSKRLNIIKVCIQRAAVLGSAIALFMSAIVMYTLFGNASRERKNASEWEQIRDTEYSEYYTEYYNDMLSQYSGTEITDFDKFIDEQIGIRQDRAMSYTYLGMVVVLWAIFIMVGFFEKFFYLTESGLLSVMMKEPEEFVVRRGNGKLGVYFKQGPNNTKHLVEFRETPDNLAALGKFIEWEDEVGAESVTSDL